MKAFAANLKHRAKSLGLSNAEIARRVGLSERRYAHYVSGDREPDFATLLRIADLLASTVDELLGRDAEQRPTKRSQILNRLLAAVEAIQDAELESFVIQAEALARHRRRKSN